jgi:hypothetical protein
VLRVLGSSAEAVARSSAQIPSSLRTSVSVLPKNASGWAKKLESECGGAWNLDEVVIRGWGKTIGGDKRLVGSW